MNLRSVDLNLLVILDALLDEAHVSRAARRLGLSQPAVSSALDRCRHLFADRLLERGRGAMRLTAKAEALRPSLKTLLADVARVLDPPAIPLSEVRQTVRLLMSDHPAIAVASRLHRLLADSAPGIDIVMQPWNGPQAALACLATGAVDLVASVFAEIGAEFHRELLMQECYVVVMRKHHPAAAGFDLDRWLAYPHVLVSGRGEQRGPLDDTLAEHGRTRRVGVVVPSFLMVPPLLEGSDLICMLPSRCVPEDAGARFALFAPPIAVASFPVHLAWHRRRDDDAGVQHVAGIIRSVLTQ